MFVVQLMLFGVVVTAEWCAPESLTENGSDALAGLKTDVYMFGGLMFELIAGREPFFWVARHTLLNKRISDYHAGACTSALDEARSMSLFRPVLQPGYYAGTDRCGVD